MKVPKSILQFLNWFPHQGFAFLACMVFIVGLLAGRAVMSIGMMMLFGNALINLKLPSTFQTFMKNKVALLLVGLFLLYVLSFFWSSNVPYYVGRVQLMLPFLVLPFAFQSIQWDRKYFNYLAMLFVIVSLLGSCWSLVQYFQNREAIDAAYGISKSMPTPFGGDHIRFGVAVVVAISFSFQLFKERRIGYWIWLLISLFLMIYVHLLASKTALLALYGIILFELLVQLFRNKKVAVGLGLCALFIVTPIIFFYTSDSFRNKIYYTKYSFEQMFNKEAQTNISDEGRMLSYQTAWTIYKKNLIMGVGAGDGLDEMNLEYNRKNIEVKQTLYPHNQFLYMALVLGTLGLLYFIYCGFYMFKTRFGTSDWMSSFLLIFLVPCMVEAFFNTQYGIAIFLFFFLLLDRRHLSKK